MGCGTGVHWVMLGKIRNIFHLRDLQAIREDGAAFQIFVLHAAIVTINASKFVLNA